MRLVETFIFLTLPLLAETKHLSLGVTGGIPLNRMTSGVPFGPDESKRYTLGLTVEASLNEHVSINFNPLYKRTGVRFGLVPNTTLLLGADEQIAASSGQVRSHSLELPVIGKYTFRGETKKWRPFVGAGFAFQTSWQKAENQLTLRNVNSGATRTLETSEDHRSPFDVGAVFSTGVTVQHRRLIYAPELRFTRWGDRLSLNHRRSQLETLFSIRF